MSELKPLPCPFCGGINIINCGLHKYCHSCGAEGPDADNGTDAGLLSAWNRRSQPAQAGQVLTDDALWELWNAQGCDDMNQSEAMKFARAIEQAVLAKRVPMTNAQIRRLYAESWGTAAGAGFQQAVRAAEKFHGIVGGKGGA